MSSNGGISGYYDRLSRWNAVARVFGYGGGRESLTVHRPLADPRAGGRATTTRVHDILLENLALPAGSLALDAGCGLGGTMLDLSERLDCRFVGLTLSPAQAAAANRAVAERGAADRVRVIVQNYDTPPAGPYQLIVAIESLAHSLRPETSIEALASVLAPGGSMAVVDDMPEPSAATSPDLAVFQHGWSCPHPLSHQQYRALFTQLGLDMTVECDLTPECRPRSYAAIARLMWWNRLAHYLPGLDHVMDSHLGGLALERLTRDGRMRYRLLVARRPASGPPQ